VTAFNFSISLIEDFVEEQVILDYAPIVLRTGIVLYGPVLSFTGPTRASRGPLGPTDRLRLFGPVT